MIENQPTLSMGEIILKRSKLFIALLCCSPALALATPQYVASVIDQPADFAEDNNGPYNVRVVDVNGDGNKDIVWMGWGEANGRELLIYQQNPNGQFSNTPTRRIAVMKEIIAYAFADIRDTPGTELLFFTSGSAYSYSAQLEGYSGNIKKLFDWPLITSFPDEQSLLGLGPLQDFNGDDKKDLLLPGIDQSGVYVAGEGGAYDFLGMIPQAHVDLSKIGNQYSSAFETLVSNRPYANIHGLSKKEKEKVSEGQGRILNTSQWQPAVVHADMDGDGLSDFVFLDDPIAETKATSTIARKSNPAEKSSDKQFNVSLFASIKNREGEPSRQFPLSLKRDEGYSVQLIDLNNDERADVYIDSNTSLTIYLNRDGNFDFAKADQVMKFNALGTNKEFKDIDGDGYPDLCVTTYDVGGIGAVATGDLNEIAIDRNILIYKNRYSENAKQGGEPKGLFNRSPDSKMQTRIMADKIMDAGSVEKIASSLSPPNFIDDINGDGIMEVAIVDQDGAFYLRSLDKALSIGKSNLWQFVPQNAVYGFSDQEFNVDAATDFILNHEKSITVLVSK